MSEQLDRLLEHNPAIVYTCSLSRLWAFTYISPNVRRIVGFEAEELLHEPGLWRSRIHPEDAGLIPSRGAMVLLQEDSRVLQYRFKHRDGTYRWLQDEVRLLPDVDPMREPFECTGSCIDITERKRAEEALQESERRFQAFMSHSPAIAFMKDEEGRFLYVNPAFIELTGFGADQPWQGRSDAELWPPGVARPIRANEREILNTGVPKAVEEVIPTPKGNRVLFTLKFPFKDAAGRTYLAGMGIDNTDRRQLEANLVGAPPPEDVDSSASSGTLLAASVPKPMEALPTGSERILLVEDEELVRELASRVLSQQGYFVTEAASGPEAMALFDQRGGAYDLLVTDVVMPGASGKEVARTLRLRNPGLKVVFISGYHDSTIFDQSQMGALDRFIAKPFSPQALLRLVRSTLDGGTPRVGGRSILQ